MITKLLQCAEHFDKIGQYELTDELTKIAEKATKKEKVDVNSKQAEALFAFMGWLTTRDEESGPFSTKNECSEAAELVKEFCDSQGWEVTDDNWTDKLKNYPSEKTTKKIDDPEKFKKGLPKPRGTAKKFKGVSLGKDKDGYYCYTHRCRSKSYSSPEKIPDKEAKWIESTG